VSVARCTHVGSSFVINIRAKSPTAGDKAEALSTFIVKPDAFMQRPIFLLPNRLFPVKRIFKFIIRAVWPQFCTNDALFWAGLGDNW
jgi:hypothetical protein